MRRNKLWRSVVTLGIILPLTACVLQSTPATLTPAPTVALAFTNTPPPTDTPRPPVPTFIAPIRMQIFRELVALQDSGVWYTEACEEIAQWWGITVDAVKAIDAEGIEKGWLTPTPTPKATPTPGLPTATPTPPMPKVAISDIFYDGAVAQFESDEYAQITNKGSVPVKLKGWRLNAGEPGQNFWFPDFVIEPGKSCRVYTNEYHPESCGFSFGSGAVWENTGDCGYLYDAAGVIVSEYCY
jgi:hypothetical protein